MARDRAAAAEDVRRKNFVVDRMRIKLNRYEFALKEAVLFLAKPMDAYDVWLNARVGDCAGVVAAMVGAVAAANTAVYGSPQHNLHNPQPTSIFTSIPQKGLHQNSSTANSGVNTPNNGNASTPAQQRSRNASASPSKQKPSGLANAVVSNSASSLTILSPEVSVHPPQSSKPNGASNLEIHCMECMRLSLNYLKNAQASINSLDKDEPPLPPPEPLLHDPAQILNIKPLDEALRDLESSLSPVDPATAASTKKGGGTPINPPSRQSSYSSTTSAYTSASVSSAVAKSRALALARLNSPERRHSHHLTTSALLRAATLQSPTHPNGATEDPSSPLFDDGDITNKGVAAAAAAAAGASLQEAHIGGPSGVSPTNADGSVGKTGSKTCTHCREYMLQLDQYRDTVETLRNDVKMLANQLEEEQNMRDRNQLAKDILDQELEELTAQLFDQANKMVIDEARLRDELECSNRDLKGELKEVLKRCEGREDELKELNRNLRALEAAKARSSVLSLHFGRSGGDSVQGSQMNISAAVGGAHGIPGSLFPRSSAASHTHYGVMGIVPTNKALHAIVVDGILMSEFQDHLRQVTSTIASQTNPNPAPASLSQETLFFKRCLVEDVEPCLFAAYPVLVPGPGGIFSTARLAKGGVNGLLIIKKRLLDCLARGAIECFSIADTLLSGGNGSPTSSMTALPQSLGFSSPTSPVIPKAKCAACFLTRECEFRVRLSDKSTAEFLQVCTFCHDRVVCVVDFFTFMGHLRAGLIGVGGGGGSGVGGKQASVSLMSMLRHVLWLKRRMAVARVGNCGLFEPEMMAAADRRSDGEWEKLVHILQ
ncbi:hypothetical protein BC830DRAFT_1091946 [Chytriomyces sp. MP71]|nr:hypothetical protein BC830DRAFT_1091946 [Chytriomyces sp. MP71]